MSKLDVAEIKIKLDAKTAEQDAKKSAKKIDRAFEQVKNNAYDVGSTLVTALRQSIPAADSLISKVGKVGIGFTLLGFAAKAVVSNISSLTGEAGRLRDISMSAQWFKVPVEQGDKLQKILNDVKSKFDALQLTTELKQIGLSSEQVENFGRTINVLAAFTGQAKSTIEASLKGAAVTDRQLAILGKTRTGLELAMARAQASVGGRALDANERVQTLIKFLNVTKKTEDALGKLGKANPFDVIKQDLKNTWEEIVKKVTPAILGLAKAFKWVVDETIALGNGIAKVISAVNRLGSLTFFKKKKRTPILTEREIRLVEQARKRFVKWLQDKAFLGREGEDKAIRAIEELQKKAAARRKRGRQQEQLEAIQELIGRQRQARVLLRNFDRSVLGALIGPGMKGAGAIIASMSRAVELSKVFTSVMGPNFQKVNKKSATLLRLSIEAVDGELAKVVDKEKQRTNLLRSQIILSQRIKNALLKENKILKSKRSLSDAIAVLGEAETTFRKQGSRTAKKMVSRIRSIKKILIESGKKQNEFLLKQKQIAVLTEKQRIEQQRIKDLQFSLNFAQSTQKILSKIRRIQGFITRDRGKESVFAVKINKLDILKIRHLIEYLKLRKKIGDTADTQYIDRQIKKEQEKLSLLKERQVANLKLLAAKKKAAKLEDLKFKAAKDQKAIGRKGEEEALKLKIEGQRKSLYGQSQPDSANTVLQLRTKIQQEQSTIESLRKQIPLQSGEKQALLQTELSYRVKMVALRKKELSVAKSQFKLDQFRTSIGGSLVLSQAQAVSDALGEMFSDLLTAPEKALENFGKSILSAFGDMAFKLAAFFGAEGLGMLFTPGGQAAGVGLIAASAAMTSVGGLLKGISASTGAPTTPSTPSTSSLPTAKPTNVSFADSIPGQRLERDNKPVVINNYYNDVPWRTGSYSPQQNFRDMSRWSRDMERSTGTSLTPKRSR